MCLSTCPEESHAGIIYGLHNGDHEIRYVGQTIRTAKKRMGEHIRAAEVLDARSPVYDWMRKYGPRNIEMCVIATFDEDTVDQIHEAEIYYIDMYRQVSTKKLLNQKSGGAHGKHSEETKQKLREYRTGMKIHSEEYKAKLSLRATGNTYAAGHVRPQHAIDASVAAWKGSHHTEEAKAKIGAAHRGRIFSDDSKAKMSESQRNSPFKGLGNHNRWHVDRGITKPDCPHCEQPGLS
jgi:hypothetical protein